MERVIHIYLNQNYTDFLDSYKKYLYFQSISRFILKNKQ